MALEDFLHPLLGKYLEAPRWVKRTVGRMYALVPEPLRLGRSYYRFRDELAAAADPEAARTLARGKLAETLRWAIETVPAYHACRGLLAKSDDPVELLSGLPVTDKLDIKRNPDVYLSGAIPASHRLAMVTGGSSRNPLAFYLQKHVTRSKEYAFIRQFQQLAGMGPRDLALSLRGRPVPGDRGKGPLWVYEPIKQQLMFSATRMDERHMPSYAEAIMKHRPSFIEAFPSMLYPFARWLRAHPLPQWNPSLRGVLLYSENVYGFQARLFEEVFHCPVLKHYGQSERVLMAASMPDDPRYFFWPTYGWFELLDAEDRPITKPGVLGHIVGTGFDNQVMPFVRYRTGDLAMLSASAHPQLAGFPACERIEGRLQEFVIDRERRAISLLIIGAAHIPALSRIDAMQYRQDRAGELTLQFTAEAPLSPGEREQMARAVGEKTSCDVTVVQVQKIERTERGKQLMLVQNLDVGRHVGAEIIGANAPHDTGGST